MRFLKIVWMVTGILLIISSCTDSYVGRWIFWNVSDIEDYEKFPNHKLDRSVTPFSFFPSSDDRQEVSFAAGQILETDFNEALEKSGTTAFLIIRNDTLLYENYFNDYSRASVNTSFSMAKSITSLLVGIALDKALIGSESDPVTKYIPELSLTDAKYSEVTINHLLNMKSGIRFADHDAPWGDKPKAYYYPDLRDKVKSLEIEYSPGEKFKYNSYNPIVLGMILEKATGTSPAIFFNEFLWLKIQPEYEATWSVDSEEHQMVKMESGINCRAIDFAKFGRLLLNDGTWGDETILSQNRMAKYLNLDRNQASEYVKNIYYQQGWWLHVDENDSVKAVAAWGHLGQYLYIFPEKNLIIARFGKKTGKDIRWPSFFMSLSERL